MNLIEFAPMLTMQAIYAIFVVQIAKRTQKNVPVYTILSLIPFVGLFFFIYVFWGTFLYLLDSINQLKAQNIPPNGSSE